MMQDALDAGGAGCVFGRQVWQDKSPYAMTRALVALIHENVGWNMLLKSMKMNQAIQAFEELLIRVVMAAVFISIDIGTTNTKGALIDQNGNLISQHSIRHVVQSSVPGWAEHNMTKDWWEDAVTIIHRLLDEYPGAASDVLSVMVSGMCPSIGITDDDGVPLRNGITQSDTREPLHGLDYYGIAPWGHSEKSTYIVPHLLWVKENEPEIYSQTRRLFLLTTIFITS